jgi:hypothetical protein
MGDLQIKPNPKTLTVETTLARNTDSQEELCREIAEEVKDNDWNTWSYLRMRYCKCMKARLCLPRLSGASAWGQTGVPLGSLK